MSHLDVIIRRIDALNQWTGRAIAWAMLAMVLVQFLVVILRYVFSVGFISMQESILYLHGIVFLIGSGFTLLHDGHVRVDIFYREAGPRYRALVDLLGSMFLLLPFCAVIFWLSYGYIMNSWLVLEGSPEASGLPLVFLLKSVIWIFAILLGLQGIALGLRAFQTIAGERTSYSAGPR